MKKIPLAAVCSCSPENVKFGPLTLKKRSLLKRKRDVINRLKLGKEIDIRLITNISSFCVWRHKSYSIEREKPNNIFQVKFNEVQNIDPVGFFSKNGEPDQRQHRPFRGETTSSGINHSCIEIFFLFCSLILWSTDRRPHHLAGF